MPTNRFPDYEVFASRPELQRREIGPVFHDLAHRVYDDVEANIQLGQVRLRPFGDLYEFEERPMSAVVGEAREIAYGLTGIDAVGEEVYEPDHPYQTDFSDFLSSKLAQQKHANPRHNYHSNPVTIGKIGIISEGISSGIIVPERMIQSIAIAEQMTKEERSSAPFQKTYTQQIYTRHQRQGHGAEASLDYMADLVGAPHFKTMINQLAYAANGFLGSASTHAHSQNALHCFYGSADGGHLTANHIFNFKRGKVAGFSEEFLARKKQVLRLTNHHPHADPEEHTGGCPVRHSKFPVVGEVATRYLTEVNGDPVPINQGESAINRGIRLVSFVLQHLQNSAEHTDA